MLISSVCAQFLDFLVEDHLSYCVSDHYVVHQGLSLVTELTAIWSNRTSQKSLSFHAYKTWQGQFWCFKYYYSTFIHCMNSSFLIGWFVLRDTGCDKTTTLTWISWCKFNTPLSLCSSRKYPYSSHGGDWKVLGGGGFSKAQKSK